MRDYDFPQFTATEWDSVKDKEKFAKHFIRFVESGYKRSLFYKWFYQRLSNTFMHIAHYNKDGFYETFFMDEQGKRDFLNQTLSYPCYGDPAFTYSDVERYLQGWLQDYLSGRSTADTFELEMES